MKDFPGSSKPSSASRVYVNDQDSIESLSVSYSDSLSSDNTRIINLSPSGSAIVSMSKLEELTELNE